MTALTEEQKAELWSAILAKIEELPRGIGSSRSPAWEGNGGRRRMAVLRLGREDGADDVYLIEAGYDFRKKIVITVSGPMVDSNDAFWHERAVNRGQRSNVVIIGEHYYSIGDPNMKAERGFGGRAFKIRRFDPAHPEITEAVIDTTNLWFGGKIPPKWRTALPSDGEFLDADPTPRRIS